MNRERVYCPLVGRKVLPIEVGSFSSSFSSSKIVCFSVRGDTIEESPLFQLE